jgi:hypothetical protein
MLKQVIYSPCFKQLNECLFEIAVIVGSVDALSYIDTSFVDNDFVAIT